MAHQTNETLRKFLHIAIGFGALLLGGGAGYHVPQVPWRWAVVVCLAAAAGNWLILHRLVGRWVSRHERGWDWGIVIYPLAVGVLIATFNWHVELAAVAWVLLAFGDGFATVVGRALPVAPLPWNRAKSWGGLIAFILFGGAASFGIAAWFGMMDSLTTAIVVATLAAALAETLPLGVDDNITVPFAAAAALAIFGIEPFVISEPAIDWPLLWPWIAANAVLAIVGWLAKSVDLSGAIAGCLLGMILIIGGGPALYVALLLFFILGTLCTKLGYRRKAAAGLAQEKGGRRGASHAFANVGVAAICAVACWRGLGLVPLFMGITALATAAADTVASEVGQLIGKRTFLPLTFRRVERGTEGAISLEGTLAGIAAAAIVAIAATVMVVRQLSPAFTGKVTIARSHVELTIVAASFLGSYLESIAGSWNRRHGSPISNGALNFFNTAAGAALFWIGFLLVPMFGFEF
jgi:uncharacterized protein (TIGR00297 family)